MLINKTLVKNTQIEEMVIKAGGAVIGTSNIKVIKHMEQGIEINLFVCNDKASTTLTDVLPKGVAKEDILAALDRFGDKGVELLVKGMKGFGGFLSNLAEKLNEKK